MDPTLTALSALFFVISMALFAYAWRERRRELAVATADDAVIDLRDPAPVTARRSRTRV